MDRIGIAVAPSDPNIVYVISRDEGRRRAVADRRRAARHWRTVNRDPNINFRPFYYADIRVDPQNPNRVYSLSGRAVHVRGWRRELPHDRARRARRPPGDVDRPADPDYILSGSDGGWQVSYDGGKNFEVVNTFSFTQFYHINYDMQKPYNVCGGLQDNGNWCGPSQTLLRAGQPQDRLVHGVAAATASSPCRISTSPGWSTPTRRAA